MGSDKHGRIHSERKQGHHRKLHVFDAKGDSYNSHYACQGTKQIEKSYHYPKREPNDTEEDIRATGCGDLAAALKYYSLYYNK